MAIFIGNNNNIAKNPSQIFVGNSSNIAKEVKSIFVGNSSNQAVQVWPDSLLPPRYRQVEYILNSNATQWIDTGVILNSDTMIGIDFTVNKLPNFYYTDTEGYGVFGCKQKDLQHPAEYYVDNVAINFGEDADPSGYKLVLRFGNFRSSGALILFDGTLVPSLTVNTRYLIECNLPGGIFKVNGSTVCELQNTFSDIGTSSYTMPLFAMRNSNGVTIGRMEIKLHHFYVNQYNNPIRDMYPCYNKTNNIIGMYDVINDVFYTNSGRGLFYKGPDVN